MLGKIIEFVKACGGAPGVEEERVEQRKLENERPFFQCGSVLYLGNPLRWNLHLLRGSDTEWVQFRVACVADTGLGIRHRVC